MVPSAQASDRPADAESDFPTSHDVVQRVRRWSRQRRIGHTGTLDPMASGVLVLCLGNATRLVEYYQNHPKQYYAEITLGRATDTYDAFGEQTQRAPVPSLSPAEIETALIPFRGDILQKPPLYSALKQGGESLHRKARRGEEVTVTPRPVTFYQLDLVHYEPPDENSAAPAAAEGDAPGRIALRVRCSAGGYIRSLAHDLGQALGTVAHLSALRREAAGPFTLDDAHPLAAIEDAAGAGKLDGLLLPPGTRLDMPRVVLDAETTVRLGHGQRVALSSDDARAAAQSAAEHASDGLAQGINDAGEFLGILRYIGPARSASAETAPEGETEHPSTAIQASIWKAEKWFAT